jgi:hypothetical protein
MLMTSYPVFEYKAGIYITSNNKNGQTEPNGKNGC